MGRQWGPACPEGKVLIFQVSSSVLPMFRSTSIVHAETPCETVTPPRGFFNVCPDWKSRACGSLERGTGWFCGLCFEVMPADCLAGWAWPGLLSLWMKSCFGVKMDCFTSDPHSLSIAAPTRAGSLDLYFSFMDNVKAHYLYLSKHLASLLLQNSLYSIYNLIKFLGVVKFNIKFAILTI